MTREDALKRDLISRADAIEAIELVDWYHQNSNKDMVHGANSDEHQAWYKADDVYKALEAVPSADRPTDGDLISRADAIRVVEKNSYRMAGLTELKLKCEIDALPSADRQRGHWIDMADFEQCSECRGTHLKEVNTYYGKATWIKTDFCPNCGADMRGEEIQGLKYAENVLDSILREQEEGEE